MTQHVHAIFTPPVPPEPSIYDQVIELVEQARDFADARHSVEALIALTNARLLLASYLSDAAN